MMVQKLLLSLGLMATPLMAKDYPIAGTASETAKKSDGASSAAQEATRKKSEIIETAGQKKDDVIETAGGKTGGTSEPTMTAENDTASAGTSVPESTLSKDLPATDTKPVVATETKASGSTSETTATTTTTVGTTTTTTTDAKVTPTTDTKAAAKPATSKADDDVQKALAKIRGDNKDGDNKDDEEEEDRYGGRKRYESFSARSLNPSRNISDNPARRSFGVTK